MLTSCREETALTLALALTLTLTLTLALTCEMRTSCREESARTPSYAIRLTRPESITRATSLMVTLAWLGLGVGFGVRMGVG